MDHTSKDFEVDFWQNVAVFTDKITGAVGSLMLKKNGRIATQRMIDSDVKKYGVEKALDVYAKLVTDWKKV